MDITLIDLLLARTPTCSKSGYMYWAFRIMIIWTFAAIGDIFGLGVDMAYGMHGFLVATTTLFLLYPISRLGAARCRARGQNENRHWRILGPAIAIVVFTLMSTDAFAGSPIPKLGFIFTALVMIVQFFLVGVPGSKQETSSPSNLLLGETPPPLPKNTFSRGEFPGGQAALPENPDNFLTSRSPPAPETLADIDAPSPPMTDTPTYEAPYIPEPSPLPEETLPQGEETNAAPFSSMEETPAPESMPGMTSPLQEPATEIPSTHPSDIPAEPFASSPTAPIPMPAPDAPPAAMEAEIPPAPLPQEDFTPEEKAIGQAEETEKTTNEENPLLSPQGEDADTIPPATSPDQQDAEEEPLPPQSPLV
ncbi:MAG TPA: hypothetical protein DCW68_02315 [Rhodospirillaceae bacterium]|nr:MAG: hypothetical protein A2018_05285 [Alphaproteobacteria bacterium GWF2_58_20]HAU28928.1 hypothetical protein [Rhodospirillaceae bacterium]